MKTHPPFLLLFFVISMLRASAAPVYEPLAAFTAAPQNPERGALLRHGGSWYGLSKNGGISGQGTLYRVASDGALTVLVHFSGSAGATKGTAPRGGLYADGEDWLWGVTSLGGATGLGTVFKYHLPSRAFITLAEFTGMTGAVKGFSPVCTLAADSSGNLWGTTAFGGASDAGTVFKINRSTGVLTTVVEFTGAAGAAQGRAPYGGVVADDAGFFWGTTSTAASAGSGSVFKVEQATGAFTHMVTLTGISGTARGSAPHGALLNDGEGFLWGTTFTGGAADGGTVFKVNPASGVFTTVADLTDAASGRFPYAGLTSDGAGFLWGTTTVGGGASGAVFRINQSTGALFKLGGFNTDTGSTPYAPLTPDGAGGFLGTAHLGGPLSSGSVYKVNGVTGAVQALVTLGDTAGTLRGRQPQGGLTEDPAGTLWGTTSGGGYNSAGTVFVRDPSTGKTYTVADLPGGVGGRAPLAGLVYDGNGYMWGTTSAGGAGDRGTLFKMWAAGGPFTSVLSFTGTAGAAKGEYPAAPMIREGAFLWGTTANGGANNRGTVFKVNILTGALTTVVEFSAATGIQPWGALVPDGAGFLWGTTRSGGASSRGVVFKVNIATGTLSNAVDFTGTAGAFPGHQPYGALVPDGAGWLWGVTHFGGPFDRGTVFKVKISDGAFLSMISFTGTAAPPKGGQPQAGLVNDGRGFLWGTTTTGGPNNNGTIFRVNHATGQMTTPFEFTDLAATVPGKSPGYGPLLLASDGHLYGSVTFGGLTPAGDPGGYGQFFRLHFGPAVTTQAATALTTGGATLHGDVNPNGLASTVSFQFSINPDLSGPITVPAVCATTGTAITTTGTAAEHASAVLTGLTAGTTYYYRMLAVNSDNPQPQTGAVLTFSTPAVPVPGLPQWLAGYGIGGANAAPGADPDGDGISNAAEYIAGTNPSQNSPHYPLTAVLNGGNIVCTFQRADLSETPDITLRLQTSTDLVTWPQTLLIASTTAASSAGVTVAENGFGLDTITVTIPPHGTRFFCRLHVAVNP